MKHAFVRRRLLAIVAAVTFLSVAAPLSAQDITDEQSFLADMAGTWVGHKIWELGQAPLGVPPKDDAEVPQIMIGTASFDHSITMWEFDIEAGGTARIRAATNEGRYPPLDATVTVELDNKRNVALVVFDLQDRVWLAEAVVLSIDRSRWFGNVPQNAIVTVIPLRDGSTYSYSELLLLERTWIAAGERR